MTMSKTESEDKEDELEAYISAKCREIARNAHCTLCTAESPACKEKIHQNAVRIHSLISEVILYRGGGEVLPEIE